MFDPVYPERKTPAAAEADRAGKERLALYNQKKPYREP